MNSRVLEPVFNTLMIYSLGLLMIVFSDSITAPWYLGANVKMALYLILVFTSIGLGISLSIPVKPAEPRTVNPHNARVQRRGRGKKSRDTMGSRSEKPPDFPKADGKEFLPVDA